MPVAQVNGTEIAYEVIGKGEPVLLVAGIGGAGSYFKPNIEAIAAKHQVVLHDHRGTGGSRQDRITYSVPQMTDDMVALMDELKIEAAHIVGHSTGAAMAHDMALRFPSRIKSAVLYAGWATSDAYFRRCFEVRKRVLQTSGPLHYVKTTPLFLNPPWWVSANIARLEAEEPAAAAALAPTDIMLSRIEAICSYSPGEELRKITCPCLITCSKDDHLTPLFYSERMAKLMPKADTFYFETGGHAVSVVLPDQFNAVVLSYLDAVIAGRKWQAPELTYPEIA
ncbi:alpha/beta fold hydrolase [Afipia broomeae]|uniref:Pyrimidine utilization protein D n=1 Tax=Afipia broomeae ATCC 49717 TaxID=883078 RepID=K8NVS9_9BRAD|nr:alpha/beta fold hydrolase [Afipia broomeae]EKS34437.1 pyrimidine utilization protein D [Afipia broomeae ATCC 49717]